jgi:anti-sigma28 factor (negative regulator of flagellin synthesis)
MSPYHDLEAAVSPELQAKVDQLKADIASGKIKVSDYLK